MIYMINMWKFCHSLQPAQRHQAWILVAEALLQALTCLRLVRRRLWAWVLQLAVPLGLE